MPASFLSFPPPACRAYGLEGRVLVVEVKNKLEKRMVGEFVEERLPRFKELFREYAGFRVEGGNGALVVKEDVGRYAEKAGLHVLTQTDERGEPRC